jgi:hypothetical protein
MFEPQEFSELRFGMSRVPEIGGQPGLYEEELSQWFLEKSFFRDFVYRNPRGRKKGQELADAVVLFDDVVLMVQVKTQCGAHEPLAWATEKMLEAFKQLCATNDSLVGGHIKSLQNDFHGAIEYQPSAYPNRIGLLILAHESTPYVAAELAPELLTPDFPVHVFSLRDFAMVARRFDTAGDMITFLEVRGDVANKETFYVQDEASNIARLLPHVEETLRTHMSQSSPAVLQMTVGAFSRIADGSLLGSADWRYGFAMDDMIARAHDVDSELYQGTDRKRTSLDVAQFLGWLTRERRIKLGKRLFALCEAGRDGDEHYFVHRKPSAGTLCVFLVSSQSRSERVKYLNFLIAYAHWKYGVRKCLGVATEPLGGGRSYDFCIARSAPPPSLIDQLKTITDPFASSDDSL